MLCCFYLFSFFSSPFHYYQLGSLMHNFSNSVSLAWRDLQTTVLRSFTRRADLSTSDFFFDMILKEFGVWFSSSKFTFYLVQASAYELISLSL